MAWQEPHHFRHWSLRFYYTHNNRIHVLQMTLLYFEQGFHGIFVEYEWRNGARTLG